MTKDRSVYIRHIYDCIGWIKEYVQAGKEAFFQDRKTQDAVIRNLEVIGQAVKDLGTDSLISSHPETPWPQIAATRNFLAHQYLGVDLTLIWNIVEQHLPQMEQQIISIAKTEGINLNAPNTLELP
ncbi:DUF86 domain-containing protein [Sulfuricella sp.]|uniref:HepT-like ribonuclease domain-containing protein n=1 Tax=Sulfuricella sp. TaxID=2099377 RepID=UPI002B702F76|nr:DUF86 domain-containing protein [Sulfuricella sp.]HUX63626.1 DUF86 domain-containing protein [Sulfuricella sp.]